MDEMTLEEKVRRFNAAISALMLFCGAVVSTHPERHRLVKMLKNPRGGTLLDASHLIAGGDSGELKAARQFLGKLLTVPAAPKRTWSPPDAQP